MTQRRGKAEVGIIGLGSMGGGMALLFSEHGSRITGYDSKSSVADDLKSKIKNLDPNLPIEIQGSIESFAASFTPAKPRIVVLSLPHGEVTDKVIEELAPHLSKDDIIMDGANEWWENTERRQKWLMKERGVYLIGLGVSGGYQAARKGPSMCPGGDEKAYKVVEPLLKKWAAKDGNGKPCVDLMGPGGAGHHVKMTHNGIEQGLLSILAEARSLLYTTLGLPNSEISEIFTSWNDAGELRDNYLIAIGAKILKFNEGDGVKDPKGIVEDVEDKIVQDVDETEGTGYWTIREIAHRHVAGPTIAAAHLFRVATALKDERIHVVKNLKIPAPSKPSLSAKDKEAFIEDLRMAVYGGTLASFIQGYGIIARASLTEDWHIALAKCNNIWRAGCIIQSNEIADMLQPILEKEAVEGEPAYDNLLRVPLVATELRKSYEPLKRVLRVALDTDAVTPALSATLEWIKTVGGGNLPTNFMESEMDFFGAHNYDIRGEHRYDAKKGAHHTEWQPAE